MTRCTGNVRAFPCLRWFPSADRPLTLGPFALPTASLDADPCRGIGVQLSPLAGRCVLGSCNSVRSLRPQLYMSPCHCVKFPCGSRRTSREKQATDRMAAGLRRKPKPPAFTVSALWVHGGKLSETTDRPICCVLTGGNRSGTRTVAGFQPLRVSPEPEPPASTGSALLQGANTPGFVSTYIAQVLDSQRKATRHKGMSGDVVVLNTHGRRRKTRPFPLAAHQATPTASIQPMPRGRSPRRCHI